MSTLHILNRLCEGRAPAALARCASAGDALLLCGDAVYAVFDYSSLPPLPVAALMADVVARGLSSCWPTTTSLLDYGDFVDLCAQHDKSLSWG